MACSRPLVAAVLLALLACACAQNYNADDARELGSADSNYCGALCVEAGKRNPSLSKLVDFCKSECQKCVVEVQKTQPGKKASLPAPCQTAYRFKEIPIIIAEFKSGKIAAEKGKP